MGNFSISHYSKLTLGPSALDILYLIDMAEVPTFQEKPALDLDGDGAIGSVEKQQYITKKADELTRGLRLSLNGNPTPLEKVSEEVELIPGGLGLPTLKLMLRYQLNWARVDLKETNRLEYEDRNFPGRVGWKEITAVSSDGIQLLESSVPAVDLTRQLTSYPEDPTIRPPEDLTASLKFRKQLLPSGTGTTSISELQEPSGKQRQLLATGKLKTSLVSLAVVVALGVGAFMRYRRVRAR